jgi:ribosomal protein S18 acetylase RimI-like enzyme
MTLFAPATLAGRIEHAESTLIADGARASAARVGPQQAFVIVVCGGAAAYAGAGSPFNKVAGLGFAGVPGDAELEEIEREFAARGASVQIEISTLADPAVARRLTRRGYELVGFENVLGLLLTGVPAQLSQSNAVEELSIVAVDRDRQQAWRDAVVTAFLHPDTFDGPRSHEQFEADTLARVYDDLAAVGGFERQLAVIDGQVAGGASLRVYDGIAQLCGAGTLPAYRRRGVQSALLAHRLHHAARRGCDVAVVTTQPGSVSQRNVQRAGFDLIYARSVLVKG